MRIGTRRSAAIANTGARRSSSSSELLCARVQLDAARAAIEAALGLGDRLLGEVEPDERDHPAVRAGGQVERPVVAGAEPRVAVGLVQAEDVAARDPVPVQDRLELVVAADHAVDVVAEVRMGVEDVRARRQLRAELGLEGGKELLCSLELLAHPLNLPAVPRERSAAIGSAP